MINFKQLIKNHNHQNRPGLYKNFTNFSIFRLFEPLSYSGNIVGI